MKKRLCTALVSFLGLYGSPAFSDPDVVGRNIFVTALTSDTRKFVELTVENLNDFDVKCKYIAVTAQYIDAQSGLDLGFRNVILRDLVVKANDSATSVESGLDIIRALELSHPTAEINKLNNSVADIRYSCDTLPPPAPTLSDLRRDLESDRVTIMSRSTESALLGKAANFPDITYEYSNFGYVTLYTFQGNGAITQSSRAGSVTYTNVSAEYWNIVENLKRDLLLYAHDTTAQNDPVARRLIEKFNKFLMGLKSDTAPASSLRQSFQSLTSALGNQYFTLYSLFPTEVGLSYDAPRSEIRFIFNRRAATRVTAFKADGTFSDDLNSELKIHAPGQAEYYQIAKNILADVSAWRQSSTSMSPETIRVCDLFIAYLNVLLSSQQS